MVKAGGSGHGVFCDSLLITNLARRIVTSESLARQRARSLKSSSNWNYQIIQRMLTGTRVADEHGFVRMANRPALAPWGYPEDFHLAELPTVIHPPPAGLQQQNPELRTEPFKQVAIERPYRLNFATLQKEKDRDVIVFLEIPESKLQQAQHLKNDVS